MKAIEDITMKELIPQRPPFVMIDRLLSCDKVVTVTELKVREDNLFVTEGHFSAEGLMENIAQTCAARMGYINLSNGDRVKIGVIGAVSNYNVIRTPQVGELITTTIEIQEEMLQITLVKAVIKSHDEILANADMKIALMDTYAKD